jgi:hypothetical protein
MVVAYLGAYFKAFNGKQTSFQEFRKGRDVREQFSGL